MKTLTACLFVLICVYPVFSIPDITVLSPNGGEHIPANSSFVIAWTSTDLTGDVTIEYSVDAGANWLTIIGVQDPNAGQFIWEPVPLHISNDCQLRISSINAPAVFDVSDAAFRMYRCLQTMLADMNIDCYVDMVDLALLSQEWLRCGNPYDAFCHITGCVPTSLTDEPDDAYTDENCDGIDGDIARAIFVDVVSGDDANSGLEMSAPKKTIQAGIDAAVAAERDQVLVSQGIYAEPQITLAGNVSIYGGYNAAINWSREGMYLATVASTEPIAVSGDSVTNIRVELLDIQAADATVPGASAYAVLLNSASAVTIHNCVLNGGKGAAGAGGMNGHPGQPGSDGTKGQPGCEDSSGFCDTCPQPQGGAGAPSAWGMNGGKGGNAGRSSNNGYPGQPGYGQFNGGAGGTWPNTSSCLGSKIPSYPANGGNGTTGINGLNGQYGAAFGSASASGYLPANGGSGTDAGHGYGGGGGGGGHGGTNDCDSYGSSGGGAGSGGQGGGKGYGGYGGGGSFGLLTVGSTAIAVDTCYIITNNGGAGGPGGTGGSGGSGGTGAAGGDYGGSSEQDDGGCGGYGGDGGTGGTGGHGGGGGGGPSIGILSVNSDVTTSEIVFAIGSAGSGGPSNGESGQNGISMNIFEP